MLGNCLDPGRGSELPAFCLAWDTAGSLFLQQPPEIGQGEEEDGELDRVHIEAIPWLGRAAAPS